MPLFPRATSNEVARPTESDGPPVGGWGLWPTFRHTESIKETSEMTTQTEIERYADQLRRDAETAEDGVAVGLLRAADGLSDMVAADPVGDMAGVWTAITVDQTGGIHTGSEANPTEHPRILVVRALLGASEVYDIQYQQVLYEAQGWKDANVEWAEAQAVAAALNAVQPTR